MQTRGEENHPLRHERSEARKRGVFDVHKGEPRGFFGKIAAVFYREQTINLRPKFYRKHPWLTSVVSAVFVLVMAFGTSRMLIRAEVADFFPAACLGDWKNPELAQGTPQTLGLNEPRRQLVVVRGEKNFNEENSAIFDSGLFFDEELGEYFEREAQIFCGSFVPSEYESRGTVQRVGLTLAWQAGEEPPPSPEILIIDNGENNLPGTNTTTTDDTLNTTSEPPVSGTEEVLGADISAGGVDMSVGEAGTSTTPAEEETASRLLPELTSEQAAKESGGGEENEVNENETEETNGTVLEEMSTDETSPPADETDSSVDETSPPADEAETSWFRRLLSIALAQESDLLPAVSDGDVKEEGDGNQEENIAPQEATLAGPSQTAEESTEVNATEAEESEESTGAVIIAPPIEAVLQYVSTSSGNASSNALLQEPTGSDFSMDLEIDEQPPVVEAEPDENFLVVSYSTDGKNWFSLGAINKENWQNFTVSIPLKTWGEVKSLQVKINTIPTSLEEIPKVYLDGMFAEVDYEIPPVFSGDGGAGDNGEASGALPENATSGEPVIVSLEWKPEPINKEGDFRADEIPVFDLDLENLPL